MTVDGAVFLAVAFHYRQISIDAQAVGAYGCGMAIRNTARIDPLIQLLTTMGDGGIEQQEAQGQRELARSSQLPTDGLKMLPESWGIVVKGATKGDAIFTDVELPAGWQIAPTDHSMWSKLIDDQGRERASIFYKAAFYDRRAHIHPNTRYSARFDYKRRDLSVAQALDGEVVLFTTEPVTEGEDYDRPTAARKLAEAWLDGRYPDWRSPAAYW